ncbi:hypothetical protein LX36DRAFT_438376 [Colletotrichum falcatum]|nr:hypothetical protein LX36DRAFT_438376 [Colletotrichum falcatum]
MVHLSASSSWPLLVGIPLSELPPLLSQPRLATRNQISNIHLPGATYFCSLNPPGCSPLPLPLPLPLFASLSLYSTSQPLSRSLPSPPLNAKPGQLCDLRPAELSICIGPGGRESSYLDLVYPQRVSIRASRRRPQALSLLAPTPRPKPNSRRYPNISPPPRPLRRLSSGLCLNHSTAASQLLKLAVSRRH